MGSATPVILNFTITEFPKVTIETSDGYRYISDLSSLSKVYCFPKDLSEWKKVSIDSVGLGLVWSNRFEVHVDQIIGLADKTEKITNRKFG